MGNSLNGIVFQPPQCSYSERSLPGLRLLDNGIDRIATCITQRGPTPPALVIFFSHGNAEDLGEVNPYLVNLCNGLYSSLNHASVSGQDSTRIGVAVVGYDYPGYGLSTGAPYERAVFECARLVFADTLQRLQVKKDNIVLYGRSLGSGPTCFIARCCVKGEFDNESLGGSASVIRSSLFNLSAQEEHKEDLVKQNVGVPAIVLQSPLLSVLRVGLRSTTNVSIPFDLFRNLERAKRGFGARTHVFVIHGKRDEVVPFDHGEKLLNVVGGATSDRHRSLFVEDAGHNDVEVVLDRKLHTSLEREVIQFILGWYSRPRVD